MDRFENILMIAGQQQNVGKTTLLCNIISHISRQQPVYAIKVTPHYHKNTGKAEIFIEGDNFEVFEETTIESNKDTSRMLKAGAERAFLLQGKGEGILRGFLQLMGEMPENAPVVCESAGLREYVQPGLFLMLRQLYCKICSIEDENLFKIADRIVTFTVNGFDLPVSSVLYEDKKWQIR